MATQSTLEKIGFERRKEDELLRKDISKTNEYNANHDSAKWHEGDESRPHGKGTNGSYENHTINPYNSDSKNYIKGQLDITQGGGSYDIYGAPNQKGFSTVGGGRKELQRINVYGPDKQYSIDAIDTSLAEEDGQFFIK